MKVFVFCIDGGDFKFIKPWAKEGYLKNLAKFMREGSYSEMETTPLPLTAPAWVSFMTGKNPGKHGLYDFVKLEGYQYTVTTSRDIKSETLLELLGNYNKKVISINLPYTYPPFKVNGIIVSGMPAFSLEGEITYPPDIHNLLKKINYTLSPTRVYDGKNEEALLEELIEIAGKRKKLALELIKKPWDVFILHFLETDVASHWFYKHYDATHPLHRPGDEKYKDAIKKVYGEVDKAIGEILDNIDTEDIAIFIVSDHGFSPLHKEIYINNFLIEKGYLKLKRNIITRIRYFLHRCGWTIENLYSIVQKLGLASRTLTMSEEGRKFFFKFLLSLNDIDWKNTTAFSATNYGPIYINLKDKFPEGIVDEKDYETIVSKLINELKEIKDGDEIVITEIYRKEEIYAGEQLKYAPDIIFLTKDMRYSTARYFEFGSNKLFGKPERDQSGNHSKHAIFIAWGKNIKKTRIKNKVRIYDIMPTILYILGISIPDDVDGRVLEEILKNEKIKKTKEEIKKIKSRKKVHLDKKEEDLIKERLRMLGYTA